MMLAVAIYYAVLLLFLLLPTGESIGDFRHGNVRPFDENSLPIFVAFGNDTDASEFELQGATFVYEFGELNAAALIVTPEQLAELQQASNVEVEPDVIREPSSYIPSRFLRGDSDVMKNNQAYRLVHDPERFLQDDTFQSNLAQIQVRQAHQYARGQGIKICVIDSGIDINHGAFDVTHFTGREDPELPWNQDTLGHGTHVTGIFAASGAQDTDAGGFEDIVGVAPDVDVYVVRTFGDDGRVFTYSSGIVNAALECVSNGANIINMALAGKETSLTERRAFARIQNELGVLVVAAAGNFGEGADPRYPAAYPEVVSVAAVDSANQRAFFSQTNENVDIAAPGVDIISTHLNGNYAQYEGTSMACAHVSGVAALLWSFKPTATVEEIKNALFTSANDLGFPGKDIYFGHGLVQALDALEYLNGGPLVPLPTVGPLQPTPSPQPPVSAQPTPMVVPTIGVPPVPDAPIVMTTSVEWEQVGMSISGDSSGDACGKTIAMNGDGTIVAVACPLDNNGDLRDNGLVRVFQRIDDNSDWTQIGQSLVGEGDDDGLGFAMDLNAEGNILAIGTPSHAIPTVGLSLGLVRVYELIDAQWTQIGNDVVGSEGDECGWSLSLSLAGNVLAVGCPSADGSVGFQAGAVRLFQLNVAQEWSQIGEIEGLRFNEIGDTVVLSGDGSVVAFSSINYSKLEPYVSKVGYVAVYRRSDNGEWERVGNLIEGSEASARFGTGLSLSEDGTIVAGGSPGVDTLNDFRTGRVNIFELQGESWVEIGVINGESEADEFGEWLDLSGDGGVIAIGAVKNDADLGQSSGHAKVFRRNGSVWLQVGLDLDAESGGEQWGQSVKISRSGNVVAAGASKADGVGGQARIYELVTSSVPFITPSPVAPTTPSPLPLGAPPVTQAPVVTSSSVEWEQIGSNISGDSTGDDCGSTIAMNGDGTIVAVACPLDNTGDFSDNGIIRVFQNVESTWTQVGQTLEGTDDDIELGHAMDMSADGTILAIGEPLHEIPTVGEKLGRVVVYQLVSGSEWVQLGEDILGGEEEECGWSVSLSLDGRTVALGCPRADGPSGTESGAVRVYDLDDDRQWIQVGNIGGEARAIQLGFNVALNGDGTMVAISSIEYDIPPSVSNAGYIAVYQRMTNDDWTLIGDLIEGTEQGARFGTGLALSEDGMIVAGGSPDVDTLNDFRTGRVNIFELQGGSWVEIGILNGEGAGDDFGQWLDVSSDGGVIAIGAMFNDMATGQSSGHVQVYRRNGSSWDQVGVDIDGQEASEQWGRSINLSRSGDVFVAGASKADGVRNNIGNARIYKLVG